MTDSVPLARPDLEAILTSFVTKNRLAGAAAGVICDGKLAWSAGAGFADVAARRPAEPTALYRIASVTKTLTGTAIMQLRDAGTVQLDDPAVRYLPELRDSPSPPAAIEALTIRRLLSHESGLASEPPGTDFGVPVYEGLAERTLARAADIVAALPPHRQQKYSNLAYQLLGEVVSRVTGAPYPRYVREAILDPLGMSATSFEPLPEPLSARCVTGYAPRTFSDELDAEHRSVSMSAEGGLWSSVADLAKWVTFQLRAHETGGEHDGAGDSAILAAATLREMHQPRYLGDDGWSYAWGIAWAAIRQDDVTWIQHPGGIWGFSSDVCFDPVSGVGAVALVNGSADASGLAMELAGIARAAVRAQPVRIEPPLATPPEYRPLLGLYALPNLSRIVGLHWRDGKLAFVDAGADTPDVVLAPGGAADSFVSEPGVRTSGEPVVFHRLPDGRVSSVFLAGTTFVRLDRVSGAPG